MPSRRVPLAFTVAALAALVATPAVALAGEVTGTDAEYAYVDTAGNETNRLVVTRSGDDTIFTDSAGAVDNSTECAQTSATVVTCTSTNDFRDVDATLAGGDDELDGSAADDTAFTASGGAGEDKLTGGPEQDTLSGEGTDDVLTGNGQNDTLIAGPGDDDLRGGDGDDELLGEAGADDLQGGDGEDELTGGADADVLEGGGQANEIFFFFGDCGDTIHFPANTSGLRISLDGLPNDDTGDGDVIAGGIESIEGGDGNDTLIGNDSRNCIESGDGDDVLEGRGGPDTLEGRRGGDILNGEGGGDQLYGESASEFGGAGDVYIGGDDIDSVVFPLNECDAGLANCTPRNITVTIDGQANDGAAGEGDDVRLDVEDVSTSSTFMEGTNHDGRVDATGSAAFNTLGGSDGDDVFDPAGGSDLVFAGDGADTVNARDGSPDRILCEDGEDTAHVDQFDEVSGCETVDRVSVTPELEDRAPTLTLLTPAAGATLDPNAPTVLRADAADDRGLRHVLFMDDDRVLCRDEAPPYECSYQPRGEDVRANTLTVAAVDTSDQAAFVLRSFGVSKFRAGRLSLTLRRGRASGRLELPAALTQALGCRGAVKLTVRSGRRTITRTVTLSESCRYQLRIRSRRRVRVRIRARFGGNAFVLAATSARKSRRG